MVATRGYLRVKVDLPESGPLTLFNLHPTPGRFSDQSSDYSDVVRKAQLEQLLAAAKATPGNVLLLGDFNCGPEVSSVNYQQPLEAGAADVWDLAAERLNPELTDSWDPLNPLNVGNVHSHCPAQRIDHIFLSPQLSSVSTVASAGVVLHESVVDLAEGGPVPLSDHYGMFAELKFGSGDSEE
jgi:endonuclease/exonuclease/phosphatase family metal-dependent hydrolase